MHSDRTIDKADPCKAEAYATHVAACRGCFACQGVVNPLGCSHPSPWAQKMGSLDARVVVVGKDFSSARRMRERKDWCEPDPKFPVNAHLPKLLKTARLGERDVYLTNAILCLKEASTSASLQSQWIENCAPLLRRTIEIIAPQAVVALGKDPWCALGHLVAGLPDWATQLGREPVIRPGAPALFAMGHPGYWGTKNRPAEQQEEDWRRLGDWLSAQSGAPVAA